MTKLDIELELRNDPKSVNALQKTPKDSDVVKGITQEESAKEVNEKQSKNNPVKIKSIQQISREKPLGNEKIKPKINYTKQNHMDKYDVYDKMNARNPNFKSREKPNNGYNNRNVVDRINPNRGNRFKNTTCFNCNKLGHIAINCWRRVNPQSSNYH